MKKTKFYLKVSIKKACPLFSNCLYYVEVDKDDVFESLPSELQIPFIEFLKKRGYISEGKSGYWISGEIMKKYVDDDSIITEINAIKEEYPKIYVKQDFQDFELFNLLKKNLGKDVKMWMYRKRK